MLVSCITLVVVLGGILVAHFVLSLTKLTHGSKHCPANILMGKLGRKVRENTTAYWVGLTDVTGSMQV